MKIVFDYQVFGMQEFGGISRYFCDLANNVNATPEIRARIIAPLHVNAYLPYLPKGVVSGIDMRGRYRSKKIFHATNFALTKLCISLNRPDIFHETWFPKTSLAPRDIPLVTTIYDMIHERFAGMFSSDNVSKRKRDAVSRADHIICISQSTKKDLMYYFDTPEDKISVVYIGFEPLCSHNADTTPKDDMLDKPYFLYVGQRGSYKNFKGFVEAYAESTIRFDFDIVCFGGGVFTPHEKAFMASLGLAETQIRHVGGEDIVLANYYRHAWAFVYPSLYEGFGIPPLEAMALDCPVICSQTSSVPEVVGDAAEYFDPSDRASLRASLERVAYSLERRAELIKLGRHRYHEFAWTRCAKETIAVYRSLL